MSKLPSGPAKAPRPKPTQAPVHVEEEGLVFGFKRNYVFGAGAVLALVVAFLVFGPFGGDDDENDAVAQDTKKGRGKGRGRGGGGVGKGLCQIVRCDEEQKSAVRPLVAAYREAVKPDEKAMRQAYAEIAAAYSEEEFDDGALDDAFSKIAEHRSAVEAEARATLGRVHQHLTTDQRETLAKLVARDGPASLFDKKNRGVPDRPRRNKGKRRKERREAKRAAAEGRTPERAKKLHEAGDRFRRERSQADKEEADEPARADGADPI